MHKLILQANELFKNCGFPYFICGGFALDMFAGKELRPHGDFDMAVFKENKHEAIQFLIDNNWPVYIRFPKADDLATFKQFYLINDTSDKRLDEVGALWSVKPGSFAEMIKTEDTKDSYTYYIHEPRLQGFDFIELAFDTQKNNKFVWEENPSIALELDKAILYKDGVPYMAPELVLFLKSPPFYTTNDYQKPKTAADFKAIIPLLSDESKKWLIDALETAYPDGYKWLDGLGV